MQFISFEHRSSSYCFINSNAEKVYISLTYNGQQIKRRVFIEHNKTIEQYHKLDSTLISTHNVNYNFVAEYYDSDGKLAIDKRSKEHKCVLEIEFAYHRRKLFIQPVKTVSKMKPVVPIFWAKRNDHIVYEEKRYRITRFTDESYGSLQYDYTIRPFSKICDYSLKARPMLVCYDCETCMFKAPRHSPYLMYAIFTTNCEFIVDYKREEAFEHFNMDIESSIGTKFVWWIQDLLHEFQATQDTPMRVFGYNNNNFDDNFILQAFIDNNWSIQQRTRNKRISATYLQREHMRVQLVDLIKWIPDTSLSEACKDFGTLDQKAEVDIVYYNSIIEKSREKCLYLPWKGATPEDPCMYNLAKKPPMSTKFSFFDKNYLDKETKLYSAWQFVYDYCRQDVIATFGLYSKINDTLGTIVDYFEEKENLKLPSKDIFDYLSPAHFISVIYKQIFTLQGQVRIKMENMDFCRTVLKAYYGGLVNFGAIGEYRGQLNYMDVTSMYPLAMTGLFPSIRSEEDIVYGRNVNITFIQRILDDALEKRNAAKQNKQLTDYTLYLYELCQLKAIVECSYYPPEDKTNLITFAPCPYRFNRKDKIIYEQKARENVILCTAEFKNLIMAGFKIIVHESKYNIMFPSCDYIFKPIMKPLGDMKAEAKQSDNNALKKLIKLFMNSIAGKLGQNVIHTIGSSRTMAHNLVEILESDEVNLGSSLHYLACFITAESRHILYSVMYRMQLKHIYEGVPLSARVGSLLYLDTDSIVYDNNLIDQDNYKFNFGDELGYYQEEKCEYFITWKQKYAGVNGMIILARKAYVTLKISEKQGKETIAIASRTLKGMHKMHMSSLTYENFKKRLRGDKEPQEIKTLLKQQTKLDNVTNNSTNNKSFIKEIIEKVVKKTISATTSFFTLEHTLDPNGAVYLLNKKCLEGSLDSNGIPHMLIFTCSEF